MKPIKRNHLGKSPYFKHDLKIVKDGMYEILSNQEFIIIFLIFWRNQRLHEIAEATKIPFEKLLKVQNDALQKLKYYCLAQYDFSISESNEPSIAA